MGVSEREEKEEREREGVRDGGKEREGMERKRDGVNEGCRERGTERSMTNVTFLRVTSVCQHRAATGNVKCTTRDVCSMES